MLKENVKICYYKIKKNTGHSSSLNRTLKCALFHLASSLSPNFKLLWLLIQPGLILIQKSSLFSPPRSYQKHLHFVVLLSCLKFSVQYINILASHFTLFGFLEYASIATAWFHSCNPYIP